MKTRREPPKRGNPQDLRTCIACGARKMERMTVSVTRRTGRGTRSVVADVCAACGERYFDLEAMRVLEG